MSTNQNQNGWPAMSEAGKQRLIRMLEAFSITKYRFTEEGYLQILDDATYVIPDRELTKQEHAMADMILLYPLTPESSINKVPESWTGQGDPYSHRTMVDSKFRSSFLWYLCPPVLLIFCYWCRRKVRLVKKRCKRNT